MGLNLDILSNQMEKLFNDVIIQEKINSLGNLKEDLFNKKNDINDFRVKLLKRELGKNAKKLSEELAQIESDFNILYDNFDDKLMIFIIGNGNVGKSTLLNSLIGEEVAETNFLPNTWKIDIYSPELEKNMAVVKYSSGKQEKHPIDKAKQIVSNEEKKSKESKKTYNQNLNQALKGLKTKEEREEMKSYLGEKYLYKSNISEVRWPVDRNWILEKCLLVDTPGLNQNLHDLNQLGNIHDYYHKADGVLWLLDGQTIAAANANSLFDELDEVLKTVGGVRDNIISVVNRMDLVRENGGEEAVLKVINDAKRIFGNKFSKIIGLSAQQAFDGVKNNNKDNIEKSGMLNLQNAIRDIFISKSDSVKNNAKIQGHNKLIDLTLYKLDKFYELIEEYEIMYLEKDKKLNSLKEKLKSILEKDVESFFQIYLNEVSRRVDMHINSLSEGQGPSFVKNTMYKLDEFIKSRDKFIQTKQLEIKNNSNSWEKFCRISEYKYITTNSLVESKNVLATINLDLSTLNSINYFTPKVDDDLFSFLGNVLGKVAFAFRKSGIKSKINDTMAKECDKMREAILKQLNDNIDKYANSCSEILNVTFKDILFNFTDVESIKKEVEIIKQNINKERENIKLKDIIL